MSEVLVSERGSIVTLTLNRPERRNALSRSLMARLDDTLSDLAADPSVRAIVIAANGTVFCAGMDLHEMASLPPGAEGEAQAIHDAEAYARLLDSIHRSRCATVAAVQGHAVAGGAGLAMGCDFVVLATEATIGFPEVKHGLVPAIVLHDLTRLAGQRRARELALTGRLISSEEAERWGLVNRVVPSEHCLDEARALAQSLLACAPGAIAATKKLLDDEFGRPHDLLGAAAVSASARLTDEAREGVVAFGRKVRPAWFIDAE